jgi:hypothetical protein
VARLQVSKLDCSPTPEDTSGEQGEETEDSVQKTACRRQRAEDSVQVQTISEIQYTFLESVFRRNAQGES